MAQGVKTDRNLLHEYLWEVKDRNGVVKINQQELAPELGISNFTLSHLLIRMVEEGRLERRGNSKFLVNDPVTWRFDTSTTTPLF